MANDTIGYQTIVDRTDGWGEGYGDGGVGTLGYVDPNAQPTADATPETLDERADRLLAARKQGDVSSDPDLTERSKGFGGEFDTTAGADNGYRTSGPDAIWDAESESIGTSKDVTFTGSNTEYDETSDPEFDVTNRTSVALPTSSVAAHRTSLEVVGNLNTVGSIVDRTDNWGHSAGSQSDRKD